MRAFIFISISAVVLTGCLTTQENPNYEHSTAYRNAPVSTQQYASLPVTQSTAYTEPATSYIQTAASVDASTATYAPTPAPTTSYASSSAYQVYAHRAPAASVPERSVTVETAPTDLAYAGTDVTGTPGFMAMQNESRAVAVAQAAPSLPAVQVVTHAPIGAAGRPIAYDYSRNLITADALTTGQQPPETVRILQGSGQSYRVQPGDTVYSLSRETCVGVNVIQSMNGLGADYGIQIGQSLTLPASVC